ncbi:hypothetical protein K474DRAFT_932535 [Panus rudis PR-1116 ss-1]|nr:hypothetical protein K474DRAFT_932535 [Panus rudis PR-1116 ss-1]
MVHWTGDDLSRTDGSFVQLIVWYGAGALRPPLCFLNSSTAEESTVFIDAGIVSFKTRGAEVSKLGTLCGPHQQSPGSCSKARRADFNHSHRVSFFPTHHSSLLPSSSTFLYTSCTFLSLSCVHCVARACLLLVQSFHTVSLCISLTSPLALNFNSPTQWRLLTPLPLPYTSLMTVPGCPTKHGSWLSGLPWRSGTPGELLLYVTFSNTECAHSSRRPHYLYFRSSTGYKLSHGTTAACARNANSWCWLKGRSR